LVAPADDFFLLFHALERGMNHIDRDNFEQLKESTAAARKNFAVRFFEQRRTFKQEMARWQALHRLYEQSRSVLLDDFPDFYVVTTKDRDSVERLAVCHGYRRKVLGIYSRDISTDKQVLFERLFSDAGIKPSTHRIIFVDDNREHLERVKSLELVSRLAGWGYTGPITEGEFPIIHNLKEIDYQSQAFM
ncbi:MAG TPA: hypothetical protein VIE65_20425, partial [Methylobacter sp.]